MKELRLVKKFILGFVLGALLFGAAGAMAASSDSLRIERNVKKVVVNGNEYDLGERVFSSEGTQTVRIHLDACLTDSGVALKPEWGGGSFTWEQQRTVCIGGNVILLPKDVFLKGSLVTMEFAVGEKIEPGINEELPGYVLKRGDRQVIIGRGGLLLGGEPEALKEDFAFLKPYARVPSP